MLRCQEQRHIYYDRDLQIEAYNLSGIVQKFPNHFHEYYVIGFVEGGRRHLWCKGHEYDTSPGDMILFNPRDNHFCSPIDGEILDYRAVNLPVNIMADAVKKITGMDYLPHFTCNVVSQCDIVKSLNTLYTSILFNAPRPEKEQALYFLLEQILANYAVSQQESNIPVFMPQIQELCDYMEEHFAETITLDGLLSMTDFGKSYLLRCFTRQTGVSPYRYLQTVRLTKARSFMEQGIPPVEAADMAGFSDQSHFTNFFKEFTGLTPKQYQRIFKESGQSGKGESS